MNAPKYLKNHSNYSLEDYIYLHGKGYSNREIEAIWTRDARDGKSANLVNKYTINFPNTTSYYTPAEIGNRAGKAENRNS